MIRHIQCLRADKRLPDSQADNLVHLHPEYTILGVTGYFISLFKGIMRNLLDRCDFRYDLELTF
jgi:hypothetical protein